VRIGELARKAGVNLQTIRFYERRGLLREPARTPSGYRDYTQADFESLEFIRWCQKLGFTLKEASKLLCLHNGLASLPNGRIVRPSVNIASLLDMAEEKIADIQERIQFLRTMKRKLETAIRQLRIRTGPVCPASKREPLSSPRSRKACPGQKSV
jgi:DNA-binding transcriptional MerR regulator